MPGESARTLNQCPLQPSVLTAGSPVPSYVPLTGRSTCSCFIGRPRSQPTIDHVENAPLPLSHDGWKLVSPSVISISPGRSALLSSPGARGTYLPARGRTLLCWYAVLRVTSPEVTRCGCSGSSAR